MKETSGEMRLDQAPKSGRLKIGVSVDRNSISLRPNLKKVGGDGCFSIERNDSHNLSGIATETLAHIFFPEVKTRKVGAFIHVNQGLCAVGRS